MIKAPEFEQVVGAWREDGYLFTALDRLGMDATRFLECLSDPANMKLYEAARLDVRRRRPIAQSHAEDLELALFFQHFPKLTTRMAIAATNELYKPPRELRWVGINARLVAEDAVSAYYQERCLGELEADWVDTKVSLVKDPSYAIKALAVGANPLDGILSAKRKPALAASGEQVVAQLRGGR